MKHELNVRVICISKVVLFLVGWVFRFLWKKKSVLVGRLINFFNRPATGFKRSGQVLNFWSGQK